MGVTVSDSDPPGDELVGRVADSPEVGGDVSTAVKDTTVREPSGPSRELVFRLLPIFPAVNTEAIPGTGRSARDRAFSAKETIHPG